VALDHTVFPSFGVCHEGYDWRVMLIWLLSALFISDMFEFNSHQRSLEVKNVIRGHWIYSTAYLFHTIKKVVWTRFVLNIRNINIYIYIYIIV
jgi:hypothetical protein